MVWFFYFSFQYVSIWTTELDRTEDISAEGKSAQLQPPTVSLNASESVAHLLQYKEEHNKTSQSSKLSPTYTMTLLNNMYNITVKVSNESSDKKISNNKQIRKGGTPDENGTFVREESETKF